MLRSTWAINNVRLDNAEAGWLVEASTGLPGTSGVKVSTASLPFADGLIVARGGAASSTVAISVWVDNPTFGAGEEGGLWERVSALQALAEQAVTIQYIDGVGGFDERVFEADVVSVRVSEPEIRGVGSAGAVVKLQAEVQPGWRLMGEKIQTSIGQGRNLVKALAGSGVVLDAAIGFSGSAAKVELESPVDGTSLVLNGVTSSTVVDLGKRTVSGVESWDYGNAGFLRLVGQVQEDGSCVPVVDCKITNGNRLVVGVSAHKWRR
ncbi:hypothetical protein [Trueperella pyogenes]|uniref:hypothetical protein n=1 Tax=Trueperella pyogenes TaxID=1661 RepID=UPI00324FA34E